MEILLSFVSGSVVVQLFVLAAVACNSEVVVPGKSISPLFLEAFDWIRGIWIARN